MPIPDLSHQIGSAAAAFARDGYVVFERLVPDAQLAVMREECARFVARKEAEMDAAGTDTIDLSHRGKRYFVDSCVYDSPALARWVFGAAMAQIVRRLLGNRAYLFNDQFVVKIGGVGATGETSFSWHQDSAYVGYPHDPYLTVWCALDDVTEANGTVYLLPFSQMGTDQLVPHRKDPRTNDRAADVGGRQGVPAVLPAGSVACFSSYLLHSSGANTTPHDRRVYIAQYSREPLLTPDRSQVWVHAVPFIDGERVADGSDLRDADIG